jgi:uncharacterized membrane protein
MSVDYQESIDIGVPAEDAWPILADLERWPTWTASMLRIQRFDSGPLQSGQQVRIKQPRLPAQTWTITEVTPDRSFSWASSSPGVRSSGEHELLPNESGGCTATLRLTQEGPLARPIDLVLGRLIRRYVRMEAEGLKRRSESQHAKPPSGAG